MARFKAAVAKMVADAKEAPVKAAQGALRELVEVMKTPVGAGGQMPVDTTFLQNSLDASYSRTPVVRPTFDGSTAPMVGLSLRVEALISSMRLGQKLYFGFVATYAARQNYGFTGYDSLGRYYNQPGHHFVELGLQRWPELLRKHAELNGLKYRD